MSNNNSNNLNNSNKFGFNPKQVNTNNISDGIKIVGQIAVNIGSDGKAYSAINFVGGYENVVGEIMVAMSNGTLVFNLLNKLSEQNPKQADALRYVIQTLVKDKEEGPLIKPSHFSKQWRGS